MSRTASISEIHLIGPDTAPGLRRRAEFLAQPAGEIVRLHAPRLLPNWFASGSSSDWRAAAERAHVLHLWTSTVLLPLARHLAARRELAQPAPALILHLESHQQLSTALRAYFQFPESRLRFICNSQSLASLLQRENVAGEHVGVVPESLPELAARMSKAQARAALELPETEFLVLMAPPLSSASQLALWGTLVATKVHPQAHVLLWGSGAALDGLEQFVRCVGAESAATFRRAPDMWPEIVQAVDLGVHVASPIGPRWGLLGLLAANVPLIVSDHPENRALLPGDHEAFYVRSDATREVAGAVVRAIEEPKLLATMGRAAVTRLTPFEPQRVRSTFKEETRRLAGLEPAAASAADRFESR